MSDKDSMLNWYCQYASAAALSIRADCGTNDITLAVSGGTFKDVVVTNIKGSTSLT